jgi:hypothetical protein
MQTIQVSLCHEARRPRFGFWETLLIVISWSRLHIRIRIWFVWATYKFFVLSTYLCMCVASNEDDKKMTITAQGASESTHIKPLRYFITSLILPIQNQIKRL